jgi:signal transduction histidine kinase
MLLLVVFGITYITLSKNLVMRMDEGLANEIIEFEISYKAQGINGLKNQIELEIESEGKDRIFIRLMDLQKEVIESSDMSTWGNVPAPEGMEKLSMDEAMFETLRIPGNGEHHVRVISKRITQGYILQLGSSMHDDEELIGVFNRIAATSVIVLLISCSTMGWFMARRAMSGVERVTRIAEGIGKSDLTSRVPLGDEGEEIDNLARTFNDMLERIQEAVTELKDVTNNIAHDLRSPLTRIRGIAETTMTGLQNIDEYREMAGIIVEESDGLVSMINVMLDIAMTEAGVRGKELSNVDMRRLMKKAYEVFRTIAEYKGVFLRTNITTEPLIVRGDLSQLQRMISNLLDNAIKFTPNGRSVTLGLAADRSHTIISVTDDGIGIPEQDLPRIFERFYRGDQSRTTPGNGLGLSHVQAIVHAHGGKIKAESSPGKGSIFTVILPLCSGRTTA